MIRHPDHGAPILCHCGVDAVFVEPGTEPEKLGDLFTVARGSPMRAWCLRCWPWDGRDDTSTPAPSPEPTANGI